MSEPAKPSWIGITIVLLVGGVLQFAPGSVTQPMRTTVRDVVAPGFAGVRLATDWARGRVHRSSGDEEQHSGEIAELRRELEETRLALRQEQLARTQLAQQLTAYRNHDPEAARSSRLIVPELIGARVLGEELSHAWRKGRFLDRGAHAGVEESALVLQSSDALIDLGTTSGLDAEQLVLAGRSILGKTGEVGRFTSTLLSVTDRRFRGNAQLGRPTEDGIQFGARGVIEGRDQPLCRLTMIDAATPVRVGDEVYSDEFGSMVGLPMYYGRVVRAELPPGALHWVIDVEPVAPTADDASEVQVLRMQFNPQRMMAN